MVTLCGDDSDDDDDGDGTGKGLGDVVSSRLVGGTGGSLDVGDFEACGVGNGLEKVDGWLSFH